MCLLSGLGDWVPGRQCCAEFCFFCPSFALPGSCLSCAPSVQFVPISCFSHLKCWGLYSGCTESPVHHSECLFWNAESFPRLLEAFPQPLWEPQPTCPCHSSTHQFSCPCLSQAHPSLCLELGPNAPGISLSSPPGLPVNSQSEFWWPCILHGHCSGPAGAS